MAKCSTPSYVIDYEASQGSGSVLLARSAEIGGEWRGPLPMLEQSQRVDHQRVTDEVQVLASVAHAVGRDSHIESSIARLIDSASSLRA